MQEERIDVRSSRAKALTNCGYIYIRRRFELEFGFLSEMICTWNLERDCSIAFELLRILRQF